MKLFSFSGIPALSAAILLGASLLALSPLAAPGLPQLSAFAQAAKAPSESHLKAARELVSKIQIAKTYDAFVPQLGMQVLNNVTRTRPELKKDLDVVLDQLVPEFDKEKEKLIDQTAVFFTEAMSEDEIKAVVAFYQTPAGKKFLEQQPKVLDRMVVQIDDWNRDLAQRMVERVRAEMKKKGHDL